MKTSFISSSCALRGAILKARTWTGAVTLSVMLTGAWYDAGLSASAQSAESAPQKSGAVTQAPEKIRETGEIVVRLKPGVDAEQFGKSHGLTVVRAFKSMPEFVVYRPADTAQVKAVRQRLQSQPEVVFTEENLILPHVKHAFVPNDPYYTANNPAGSPGQWHLSSAFNPDVDVNITGVWSNNFTGTGVRIGVCDDGVETNHVDLRTNIIPSDSWDFGQDDGDPNPVNTTDEHGIAVAGVAAGRGGNGIGASGAAPFAGIAGLRLDFDTSTIADFADATLYHSSGGTRTVKVKNHSYGISSPFIDTALENAAFVTSANAGTIHCVSAGNERTELGEDSNKKDFTSLPEVITVAALASSGIFADYSCFGACVAVTAPSSSFRSGELGIVTTDRTGSLGYAPTYEGPFNVDTAYTSTFGGTSSSSPLVAGVMAVVKQAQPALDVRWAKHLLSRTSRRIDPTDSSTTGGWKTNAAGVAFNPNYGFGLIDAGALVTLAQQSTGITAQTTFSTGTISVNSAIPDNNATGISRTFNVTSTQRLEEVTVTLNVTHTYRGDLTAFLTSPSGTKHRLFLEKNGDATDNISNWRFTANGFWGENPQGTWTLQLADRISGDTGTWTSYAFTARMGLLLVPVPISGVVTNLTVTPGSVALLIGGTQPLTATAQYSSGQQQDVTASTTWSSLNTSVATVNSSGLITAVAGGNTTVRGIFSGFTSTVSVAVNFVPVITNGAGPLTVTLSEDGIPTAFVAPALAATDGNHSGAQLSWSLSSNALHGTATVSGSGASPGTFTYVPAPNYNGSDSFTVRVVDPLGSADTIKINLTVNSVNDAPVITNGVGPITVIMSENGSPTPFSLSNLRAADVDHSGSGLTWDLETAATNGTATVSGTGAAPTLSYSPAPDVNGTDHFTLRVTDALGATDSITVNVTIQSVNSAPIISNGAGPIATSMSENGFPIPFTGPSLTATDADHLPSELQWDVSVAAQNGTATVSGTGASPTLFTYVPDTNFFGNDSFTVRVTDALNASDTIVIQVTVSPINTAPVITNGDGPLLVTMSEDGFPTAFVAPVLGATDGDSPVENLTWTLLSPATNGTATVSGSGAAPSTLSYVPDANFFGVDHFTVQVDDAEGGLDSIQIAVTVTAEDEITDTLLSDFTGDGQPDLLLSLKKPRNTFAVVPLVNNGDGTLSSELEPQETLPLPDAFTPLYPKTKYVAAVDANVDGTCDLLTQSNTTARLYLLDESQTEIALHSFVLPKGFKIIGAAPLLPIDEPGELYPDLFIRKGTRLAVIKNVGGTNFSSTPTDFAGKLPGKVFAIRSSQVLTVSGSSIKSATFSGGLNVAAPALLGKVSAGAIPAAAVDINTNGVMDYVLQERKRPTGQPFSWISSDAVFLFGTPPASLITTNLPGSRVVGPR